MFQTHKPTELSLLCVMVWEGRRATCQPRGLIQFVRISHEMSKKKTTIISWVITKGAVPNIGTQMQSEEKHRAISGGWKSI